MQHFSKDKGSNVLEGLGLKGKFVLGHIGQLREWVDLDTILQAMIYIREVRPDIPLAFLVVGGELELEGARAMAMRMGLADKVAFTGIVPYDDMPLYINAMDVGIISRKRSSVSDNMFPLKLLEYMACEKPVVSTPLRGVKEIAKDKVLYAATPEEYKEHIINLFDHEDTRKALGSGGRRMVEDGYDWEGICSRFEALVRETVERAMGLNSSKG
ncbi:MAG: glycosyltransferase family 4 protein [Chloroflexi bacterium]|nr:glycosyltransferase family 4 protein [Chloroflexota bacterium]